MVVATVEVIDTAMLPSTLDQRRYQLPVKLATLNAQASLQLLLEGAVALLLIFSAQYFVVNNITVSSDFWSCKPFIVVPPSYQASQ